MWPWSRHRAEDALIGELRRRLDRAWAELAEREISAAFWLTRWRERERIITDARLRIAELERKVSFLTIEIRRLKGPD